MKRVVGKMIEAVALTAGLYREITLSALRLVYERPLRESDLPIQQ